MIKTVHLIPVDRHRIPVEELHDYDARKINRAFRSTCNRAGAKEADGWMIAFLDGEYDPNSGTIHPHWHGIASGGMIKVARHLRRQPTFAHRRGVLIRSEMNRPAHAIGYNLKPFWKSVPRSPDGTRGFSERIPEPAHTHVLLWLDRYTVSDLCVMIGVRVNRNGEFETL